MPNVVQYTTGATPNGCLRKGNFLIGNGTADYGLGFYTGITPPSGGYTIYLNKASNGPSIYCPTNDTELIFITNQIAGTNYTTTQQCFNYFASQSDKLCVYQDFPSNYPYIVMDGLILNLDAGITLSYPTTGTTWNDINGITTKNNGTLTNGPTYSSTNGGLIVFDGTDDYVNCSSITWTPTSFTLMWVVNPKTRTDYNQRLSAFNDWGSFVFHTTTNGGIYVGTDVATRFTPSQLPSNTLVLDQNQIFTFTFNSGSAAFYKNGILLASRNGMTLPGPWGGFNIGRPDSNTINGTIGYVQIYNRGLTSSEVLQNYNATKGRFGL